MTFNSDNFDFNFFHHLADSMIRFLEWRNGPYETEETWGWTNWTSVAWTIIVMMFIVTTDNVTWKTDNIDKIFSTLDYKVIILAIQDSHGSG